ncbi:hypothetical protein [Cuniculiplasma divulgatum]|uniref:Restriction endonuclease n=1 Tax=Cuniculiplasma divulgatum TaxID=1673428 RepID=A0A1N5W2J6_9ARCH|nr:hypothetical protein [Cuniculiplasma divulgatum]SIM79516.1 hypothetical protein CSP5_1635 [Cuniculiplasma divulgatum]
MSKIGFSNRQITGNIGLYYICYKLSRMGWNVLPTSRNAKGIDIIAYGKQGEKMLMIQTKGYTKKAAVGPFKDVSEIIADFYIVSWNVYTSPVTYILTKEELKSVLSKHKGVYWAESKDYAKDDFLQRWDKIGYGFVKNEEIEYITKLDQD